MTQFYLVVGLSNLYDNWKNVYELYESEQEAYQNIQSYEDEWNWNVVELTLSTKNTSDSSNLASEKC